MEVKITNSEEKPKKFFKKISLNMMVYILDFVSYKEYSNCLFINLRFVKALEIIYFRKSNKQSKSFKKNVLNNSISVFFNYYLFNSFFKNIYPFLLSTDGFKTLVSQNCKEVVLYCLNVKKNLSKGLDPFEKILECIAIYFNKYLEKNSIEKIDLSKLSLGKNGCYVISHLFNINRSLTDIDLSSNDLMYEEILMLFSKYKKNDHYLSINLRKNNLDAGCLVHISNKVKDDLHKTVIVNKIVGKLPKTVNCWNIVQK